MAIFELNADKIMAVPETTFGSQGVLERGHLQRVLRANLEVVAPHTMLLDEEFGRWEDSRRRIDLLGLDKSGDLVVIELKRTDDGGHMDLQAIRYAAMISAMTFEQVVAARAEFQAANGIEGDAEQAILEFLEWEEADEDQFAQNVRIVLVSADFSKELTTAVMWLNNHDLDIRCVRLKPYLLDGRLLLDVQQVIPLPEAAEYQVRVKEKTQQEQKARKSNADFTRYDVSIDGETHRDQWKRRAILLVVKRLVEGGVSPDRISELLSWRSGPVWIRVDSVGDAEEFADRAAAEMAKSARSFKPRRWFHHDEELIRLDGHTYAFTSFWGVNWHRAMKELVDAFPERRISYAPTVKNDG